MEHPLINDADALSVEELQTRISDLQKKLGMAYRMRNGDLAHQIQMAIETYQTQYQKKQQEAWERSRGAGTDYSDHIDIS
jgi:hypothetical protein